MLDGSAIKLTQDTEYPWKGLVKLTVESCKSDAFDIALRVPEWATGATITINGEDAGVKATPATYAVLHRNWKAGDVIVIDIPMEATFIEGHQRIEEVRNQVAIKRGPVVYCIETPDLPDDVSVLDVYVKGDSELAVDYQPDFLGGTAIITADTYLRSREQGAMYTAVKKPDWQETRTKFVPYYAWSNRGTAEMTVFVPVVWK
ncbi:hypothetical protein [Paraglaciecola aquimarina]